MLNYQDNSKKELSFLAKIKKDVTSTQYRKRFETLVKEIEDNLLNTAPVKKTVDQTDKIYNIIPTQRANGSIDYSLQLPKVVNQKGAGSKTPRTQVPIAFSKILVASSALAANLPDGTASSINKMKARLYYEMWKKSWANPEANGFNTLDKSVQNMFSYGWAAWRVYPKKVSVDVTIEDKKIKKILYDDIFREPLDPRRTWFGTSYKAGVNDNRPEMYYEIDIPNEKYAELKKLYKKRSKKDLKDVKEMSGGVTNEAKVENQDKTKSHTTICFYENPIQNKFVMGTEECELYNGEMPNKEIYGSICIAHCWIKDINDPHGVGLYEFIRGNEAVYNYINSINAEQVVAELEPLLFAIGNANGTMTYERGANKINVLPAGMKVEKMLTTGNSTLGINYANSQKQEIDDITGVNNIVSGTSSETTATATVILKEAALNRLIKPKNGIKQALENDAVIYFSWLELDQINEREFVFSNEDEVKAFVEANKQMHLEMADEVEPMTDDLSEVGSPIPEENDPQEEMTEGEAPEKTSPKKVLMSPKVGLSFDYSQDDLDESDYEEQRINEVGQDKVMISRSGALKKIKELDNKIGYDKVVLKVDTFSMLIPSQEVQKQTSMQLFPLIQNALQIIYGQAKQDPEQAVAQLKSFSKFMETQRQNIFDYIPKEQYDMIMQKQMVPAMPVNPEQEATQSDGTSVTQPQSPEEMLPPPQGMQQGLNASVVRASKQA